MQIKSTTVIGAGGTGQQLIPSLMRLLKYHPNGTEDITAYDGDEFEEHNGERQVHTSGTKAHRMNELLMLQQLDPICMCKYISASVLKHIDRRRHNKGLHLVIAAVDNDATRKMCIETLEGLDSDFLFITPGNSDASDSETDLRGNVLWYGRVDGEQVGINPMLLFPNIEKPSDAAPREGSCTQNAPSTPQLISANLLAAAYTLTLVQNFLDDRMPLQASHLFFNGRNLSLTAN